MMRGINNKQSMATLGGRIDASMIAHDNHTLRTTATAPQQATANAATLSPQRAQSTPPPFFT